MGYATFCKRDTGKSNFISHVELLIAISLMYKLFVLPSAFAFELYNDSKFPSMTRQ